MYVQREVSSVFLLLIVDAVALKNKLKVLRRAEPITISRQQPKGNEKGQYRTGPFSLRDPAVASAGALPAAASCKSHAALRPKTKCKISEITAKTSSK
jgi:hypothetical protein